MPVQINGKMRGKVIMKVDANKEEAIEAAKADRNVSNYLLEKEIKKVIYVPGKILNIVVSK